MREAVRNTSLRFHMQLIEPAMEELNKCMIATGIRLGIEASLDLFYEDEMTRRVMVYHIAPLQVACMASTGDNNVYACHMLIMV